jgi:conjugal transfer pilus assembly protein TraV
MIGKAAPTLSPSLIPLQIEQRPAEKASTSELADKPLRSLPMNHLGNND